MGSRNQWRRNVLVGLGPDQVLAPLPDIVLYAPPDNSSVGGRRVRSGRGSVFTPSPPETPETFLERLKPIGKRCKTCKIDGFH
jgi:hypothetical protein